MLEFPFVPSWWEKGSKFTKLQKSFRPPDYIIGYDTETCNGSIMTQQYYTSCYGRKERNAKIEWVSDSTVLDKFLAHLEDLSGYIIVYCFNAHFDLAILLREYIDKFLSDDFIVRHQSKSGTTWEITVFCSKNWFASFKAGDRFIQFLDIQCFFSGSLETVANTFNLETKKLKRPEKLGEIYYTKHNKTFVDYALVDALLCLEIGEYLLQMHAEFDIPIASSSANFAEKVFRRNFIPQGKRIKYPPWSAARLAEISYHGGKNGYYIENPSLIHNCYEYDFNAAYGFAMYTLPSFLSGTYKKVNAFSDKFPGVYQVTGILQPCKYGILYDTRFNYFRFSEKIRLTSYCTSFELKEALQSKEFKIDEIAGWIWIPDTEENPLKEYARTFWEKKNSTPKNDVRYIFYKLLLNSLYGKWIQRNPARKPKYIFDKGQFELYGRKDVSGGLYNPFVASLITGFTRARLHQAEHFFDAIESSTDSVKSRRYDAEHASIKRFGAMQLESRKCKECDKEYKSYTGLFVRNRLNLLMCSKGHILKCALHGFWGKPEELKRLYERRESWYTVTRMPLIKEGITQQSKALFTMGVEERSLNISWDGLQIVK